MDPRICLRFFFWLISKSFQSPPSDEDDFDPLDPLDPLDPFLDLPLLDPLPDPFEPFLGFLLFDESESEQEDLVHSGSSWGSGTGVSKITGTSTYGLQRLLLVISWGWVGSNSSSWV